MFSLIGKLSRIGPENLANRVARNIQLAGNLLHRPALDMEGSSDAGNGVHSLQLPTPSDAKAGWSDETVEGSKLDKYYPTRGVNIPCLTTAEISIKRLHVALERGPGSLGRETSTRMAPQQTPHLSNAGSLAVTVHGITQAVIRRLWGNQGLHEGLTVAHGQIQTLMFFNGATRGPLNAGQHEIRDRPPWSAASCSIRFFWSALARVSKRSLRVRPRGVFKAGVSIIVLHTAM